MKLDTEFIRIPIRFDAEALAREVAGFSEADWRAHPQGHAGNSALPLIAVGGDPSDDGVKGPMRPTRYLERCPYVQQVLAAWQSVLGRTRLMRIAGQGEATAHVDTNYYWHQRVRVHVPVVTFPTVEFQCGGRAVHMAPGECWIFDTWRLHNVLNPTPEARIHLVADTVGSAFFWDLVARGNRPFARGPAAEVAPQLVTYERGRRVQLETEAVNFAVVMSPWEQECLLAAFFDDLGRSDKPASDTCRQLEGVLTGFRRQWRSLWAQYGAERPGWPAYRQTLEQLQSNLAAFTGVLKLPNGVEVVEVLMQTLVRPALNPDLAVAPAAKVDVPKETVQLVSLLPRTPERGGGGEGEGSPPLTPNPSPPSAGQSGEADGRAGIDRPIFIVAAPRSGSTLLFETLARSPSVWTIGGESHRVIEGMAQLEPAQRGYESNRLTAADADAPTAAALRTAFRAKLRDRDGRTLPADAAPVRMLEKTPKNALRIPFFRAVFPDARFIYLYREPAENLSSILEAWKSGRFVTYPQLPDWDGPPWSLLLIPDWRMLRGQPLPAIAAAQWAAATRTMLDDLAELPPDRWCGVTYADLVADPQAVMERLCRFADFAWDQQLRGPLPLSRYTLTPPAPDKWRQNEAALSAVLPQIEPLRVRALKVVGQGLSTNGSPSEVSAPLPKRQEIAMASAAPAAAKDANGSALKSVHTVSFPRLLDELGISLLVSTYQAGKLIAVRVLEGRLNTHFRSFIMPMGLAVHQGRLALGTRLQVWELCNQPEVGRKLEPAGRHDACFIPRACHVTGDIRIHDLAWAGDELWLVNTRFSCLCTLDRAYSFVPRWRPPFVSGLASQDRCHLNGLAVVEDRPRFVTALGQADTVEGWRADKAHGGCLIDVATGASILSGLSMPHSPRWHGDRLWLLESGVGSLAVLDAQTGRLQTVAELPGFTRGLDFYGPYAFVGLSQVRETAVFSGIPITEKLAERTCGVWIVDTRNGRTVGFLRFEAGVQEIFAVQVLPGIRCPEILNEDEQAIANSFVLPDEALAQVV
jgi:uncharacterized protein (TIGR03032 family)